MVAELVGVTLGPKGRNVVLQNKYGPPKIVNDGETVLKQIELEDPVENVGVKLVRQAGAKTNDLAGDGSTTAVILAHGLITEGVKGLHQSQLLSLWMSKISPWHMSNLIYRGGLHSFLVIAFLIPSGSDILQQVEATKL